MSKPDYNQAPHPGTDNLNRNRQVEEGKLRDSTPTWESDYDIGLEGYDESLDDEDFYDRYS